MFSKISRAVAAVILLGSSAGPSIGASFAGAPDGPRSAVAPASSAHETGPTDVSASRRGVRGTGHRGVNRGMSRRSVSHVRSRRPNTIRHPPVRIGTVSSCRARGACAKPPIVRGPVRIVIGKPTLAPVIYPPKYPPLKVLPPPHSKTVVIPSQKVLLPPPSKIVLVPVPPATLAPGPALHSEPKWDSHTAARSSPPPDPPPSEPKQCVVINNMGKFPDLGGHLANIANKLGTTVTQNPDRETFLKAITDKEIVFISSHVKENDMLHPFVLDNGQEISPADVSETLRDHKPPRLVVISGCKAACYKWNQAFGADATISPDIDVHPFSMASVFDRFFLHWTSTEPKLPVDAALEMSFINTMRDPQGGMLMPQSTMNNVIVPQLTQLNSGNLKVQGDQKLTFETCKPK